MLWKQSKQMPTKLRKNHKGATLVEVITVIAAMSIVMAAITGFVITGSKMSAQVSGGATAGMREQTAVEYINQRLWEKDDAELSFEGIEKISVGDKEHPYGIKIGAHVLITEYDDPDNPDDPTYTRVLYNNTELCKGEIYFLGIENNTVKYVLNGTEHVVHLRATRE